MSNKSRRNRRRETSSLARSSNDRRIDPERAVITSYVESYHGPIPSPNTLREYESILPGSAERILQAFEQQTLHRQSLEDRVITSDIRRSYIGLFAGFIVAMTAICGGLYVAVTVSPIAGATIASAPLAGLVGAFIYGTSSRRRERSQRLGGQR